LLEKIQVSAIFLSLTTEKHDGKGFGSYSPKAAKINALTVFMIFF
jgi:hypothetical protein